MIHTLKTDPAVFQAVADGRKTHEIRLNDRGFEVGHTLLLRETTHTGRHMAIGAPLAYTGREITKTVSHVLGGYGLQDGWVILSFAPALAAIGTSEPVGQDDTLIKPDPKMMLDFWQLVTAYAKGTVREGVKLEDFFVDKLVESRDMGYIDGFHDAQETLNILAASKTVEPGQLQSVQQYMTEAERNDPAYLCSYIDSCNESYAELLAEYRKLAAASNPDDGGVSLEGADMRARVHAKVLAMPESDTEHLIGPAFTGKCDVPPAGWYCTRTPGHDGPCAAHPIASAQAASVDDLATLIPRAWTLLETIARYGYQATYEDGSDTPNRVLCRETAAGLEIAYKAQQVAAALAAQKK